MESTEGMCCPWWNVRGPNFLAEGGAGFPAGLYLDSRFPGRRQLRRSPARVCVGTPQLKTSPWVHQSTLGSISASFSHLDAVLTDSMLCTSSQAISTNQMANLAHFATSTTSGRTWSTFERFRPLSAEHSSNLAPFGMAGLNFALLGVASNPIR